MRELDGRDGRPFTGGEESVLSDFSVVSEFCAFEEAEDKIPLCT